MTEEDIKQDQGTPSGEGATASGSLPAPDPTELLQAKLDEVNDRYLRMLAENENTKKRLARERMEERAYAAQEAILVLLPVMDSLERVLKAALLAGDGRSTALESLQKGAELTLRQFEDALKRLGVEEIPAPLGSAFDPTWHQALLQEDHADHEEGSILEVMQRGHRIGDRILRPSMVKVSRKP